MADFEASSSLPNARFRNGERLVDWVSLRDLGETRSRRRRQ